MIQLQETRLKLQEGLRLSRQGSYARRRPNEQALPYLIEARESLRKHIKNEGPSEEAYRLLALAEESVLNYPAAAEALTHAIQISGKDSNKDRKKLQQYREASGFWTTLCLSPEELHSLGGYLGAKLQDTAYERSMKWTEIWLEKNAQNRKTSVLKGMAKLGACDDFGVLHNLISG